jgi:hypothetical protein
MKENKKLMISAKILWAITLLALLSVVAYILAPLVLSSMLGVDINSLEAASYSGSGPGQIQSGILELNMLVSQLIAVVVFVLVVLGAVVYLVALLLSLMEILKSHKTGGWKALWILACILLGWIGVLAYAFRGRNSL